MEEVHMARDQKRYKVTHIPTNAVTYHSSMKAATDRARRIDGMIQKRDAADLRYEFFREYRYGKVK